MRVSPSAIRALSFAAALSMCATPRPAEEMTDEERKTPPEPDLVYPPDTETNRPGETNRQFAARMKAEAQP